MSRYTTILLDIGWPIIDETILEEVYFSLIINRIEEELNIKINEADAEWVKIEGIRSFAPSLFSYFIWHYVSPDVALFDKIRGAFDSFDTGRYCRLQPGIKQVLETLSKHFKLGYAANQRNKVRDYLESEGISQYFTGQAVSEEIGYIKPDQRHFTEVLRRIGSTAEETIMVGDRLDNDIIPAKSLGLTTVQFLAGPHRIQKPRYPKEIPDFVIEKMDDLLSVPPIAAALEK